MLVISHFGFEDRILVLIVPVPGQCLPFTYDGHDIELFILLYLVGTGGFSSVALSIGAQLVIFRLLHIFSGFV